MQTKGNQGLLLVYIHLCVPVGETLGCMYMVYMFPLGEKVFCEVWAVVATSNVLRFVGTKWTTPQGKSW